MGQASSTSLRMNFTSPKHSDGDNLLLLSRIDLRAHTDLERVFCALQLADTKAGLLLVTYTNYVNTVNNCA